MRKVIKEEKGQSMVEVALITPIMIGVIFAIIIFGLWAWNNFQIDRGVRHGAIYLGTSGDKAGAQRIVREHIENRTVATDIKSITLIWSGNQPNCRVRAEMETFFPGFAKLLDPSSPNWAGKITITKEATAPGEHQHTNSSEYN